MKALSMLESQTRIPQATTNPRRPSGRKQALAEWARRTSAPLRCESLELRQLLSVSCGCHLTSPVLQSEHEAVLNLVPATDASHIAIQTGDWSAAATWQGGVVPGPGSQVHIPAGISVTVDRAITSPIRWILDEGTLAFSTTRSSSLLVETIVVTPTGSFDMGSASNPLPANVSATVTFLDSGPIDTNYDPLQFSRGLISHGHVGIFGAFKTPYAALAQGAQAGSTVLVLNQVPSNWQVGDQLALTGTNPLAKEDEQLQILAISGDRVTVRPLAFAHVAPAGMSVYVANLTRNAVFVSQNAADSTRHGHVMLMHSNNVGVENAGFYALGRTDKNRIIDDPQLDSNGVLVPGTGLNARGRYAVHLHRTGTNSGGQPVHVRGSVVTDSPGWGFVNHGGNIDFDSNVAYKVFGASFVAETGDEIGIFQRNLALRTLGDGTISQFGPRAQAQDFGFGGHGFWLQGPGMAVENNIAAGHPGAAYVYFTQGLVQGSLGLTLFEVADAPDPSLFSGLTYVDVGKVPLRSFKGNVGFASKRTLEVWLHRFRELGNAAHSVIDQVVSWNVSGKSALSSFFSSHLTYRDGWVLGNLSKPAGTGIDHNGGYSSDLDYENMRIEGFGVGILTPMRGSNTITGGYYNNIKNIDVIPQKRDTTFGRQIRITGNPTFGALSSTALAGRRQFSVFTEPALTYELHEFFNIFRPESTYLDVPGYVGKQIYAVEQAANFIPFPAGSSPSYIPQALIGLTNQQLMNLYGLAVNGAVAPAGTVSDPAYEGLIGAPVPTHYVHMNSPRYTAKLQGYQLTYLNGSRTIKDPQLVNLQPGWNMITRMFSGKPYTFFVYGDVTPPTFIVAPRLKLVINPVDLKTGFTVYGWTNDDSVGLMDFKQTLTNLDQLPLQTRPDGSKFVRAYFTISDRVGNTATAFVDITVDPLVKPR